MKKLAFVGPSITKQQVLDIEPDFEVSAPCSQGDLYRAARQGFDCIAIIDGLFDAVPSVWHKEVLWTISQGCAVFGASSMGALRAVECQAFGMIGVGSIFEWYRDGKIEDDDEVALVHAPSEFAYKAFSIPMVNIRATVAQSGYAESTQLQLVQVAKKIYYPDRTFSSLRKEAQGRPAEVLALLDWCEANYVDQKNIDARTLIEILSNDEYVQTAINRLPDDTFLQTANWVEFSCQAAFSRSHEHASEDVGRISKSQEELALLRCIAPQFAERMGFKARSDQLIDAVWAVAKTYGLQSEAEIARWTLENNLTLNDLYSMAYQEVAIDWLSDLTKNELLAVIAQRGPWLKSRDEYGERNG